MHAALLPRLNPIFRQPAKFIHCSAALAMATEQTQGATLRTPRGFKKVITVKWGTGIDQHGQDPTEASVRAVKDALLHSSLPAVLSLVPGGHEKVKIKVKIGVPYSKLVDTAKIKEVIPYGNVTVKVVHGGLRSHSGIIYPKSGDVQSKEEVDADTSGDEAEEEPHGHKVHIVGKQARDESLMANASIRIGF